MTHPRGGRKASGERTRFSSVITHYSGNTPSYLDKKIAMQRHPQHHTQQQQRFLGTCNNCGRKGHRAVDCRACEICKKVGHKKADCFQRDPRGQHNKNKQDKQDHAQQQKTCARCKKEGHSARECPEERAKKAMPGKRRLPREITNHPKVPDGVKWSSEEKACFDEYVRLLELTIDSHVQKARHIKLHEYAKDKDVTVTFRSRALGEEKVNHIFTDDSSRRKEAALIEAWGKEIDSLNLMVQKAQDDILFTVKKRLETKKFAVPNRYDQNSSLADQTLDKLFSFEQQASTQTSQTDYELLQIALRWINNINVKGSGIGNVAKANELKRLEAIESERRARENKRLVQLAAVGSGSTLHISQQPMTGGGSTARPIIPPIPINPETLPPDPFSFEEPLRGNDSRSYNSPRDEAKELTEKLVLLRKAEEQLTSRLSALNKDRETSHEEERRRKAAKSDHAPPNEGGVTSSH